MTPDEDLLAELDEEAREYAPRFFALYGVFRHKESDEDNGAYLGWGMEFAEVSRAVMWDQDGSTHISDSAERMLRAHTRFGEARLRWLTDE